MIDVARALKIATDTGEVRFGLREVRRALRTNTAKLVIVASNCPPQEVERLGAPRLHRFSGTNAELGAACGVPFSIAAVAILSAGDSNILSL